MRTSHSFVDSPRVFTWHEGFLHVEFEFAKFNLDLGSLSRNHLP